MTLPTGVIFSEPYNKPLSSTGQPQANCYRKFYQSGTTTFANVYQDGNLTTPYSQNPTPITADGAGRFNPIYMDPSVIYRVQLYSAGGILLEDMDPYVPAPGSLYVRTKFSNTSITNNTSPAPDPELQFLLPQINATWEYEAHLAFSTPGASGNTPGVRFGISFTGVTTVSNQLGNAVVGFAGGNQTGSGVFNQTFPYPLTTGGALETNFMLIKGVVSVFGNILGSLYVNWSQWNASSNATILATGSVLIARRIL